MARPFRAPCTGLDPTFLSGIILGLKMFLTLGTLPDLPDDMPEYRQPLSTPGEERGVGTGVVQS